MRLRHAVRQGWDSCLLLLLTAMLLPALPALAAGPDPGPFDQAHVILLRPGEFTGEGGATLAKPAPGHYFEQLARVTDTGSAPVRVKHAGRYTLWIRVVAEKTPRPLAVTLGRGTAIALQGTINDGAGTVERGGKAAFTAYRDRAVERGGVTADGAPLDPEATLDGVDQNLIDDLNDQGHLRWINTARVETIRGDAPAYWWKLGPVALTPGEPYRLKISGGPAQISCAFLTTFAELAYPYCGDFDAPAGSYVRFRIDQFPGKQKDVLIIGSLLHHANPTFWTAANFTPDGFRDEKAAPFTQKGYTRWFRLQDLKYIPGVGGGHCHLSLTIPPGAKGVTQFANTPLTDYVVREFNWDDPGGQFISMSMDFEKLPQTLRTFRDHAAENYEYALRATGGRLFPLARGAFYTTTNGFASGLATEYFMQTARLLGANVGPGGGQQQRYGWWTSGAQYAPDVQLPFDEAAVAKSYLAYYQEAMKGISEEDRRSTRVYQIADEPGEYLTTELSAPLWRYYPAEKGGPKLADLTGGSFLYTKKTDYRNCVLEGKITMLGARIGFRVGFSDYAKDEGGQWLLGSVAYGPVNFQVVKDGVPVMTILHKEMPLVSNKPMAFKIVYARDTATLYLDGVLLNRISELKERGGFAVIGAQKALTALRLRPMTPTERRDAIPPNNDPDAIVEELGEDDPIFAPGVELPTWAAEKPLDRFANEDWTVAGGIPGARDGFLRWLKGQGVTLETLKLKSWDDARLLTIPELAESASDRRLYYWSRRYSNYLTPKLYDLVNKGIQQAYGNPDLQAFVGLSGHSLYFPSKMPMDMFQLAQYPGGLAPGVSDAMSFGGWRWDSHQAVAFSVAPYNAGARVYGGKPLSSPMMHCMWPTSFRGFTQLANNVKYISYWCFGPCYLMTEWFWGEDPGSYAASHLIDNSANVTDDLLVPGRMRPSRIALLYSMATENWDGTVSFADKRATFLALTHDYFPAELVTEEQVASGALKYYDALYVLDPYVATGAQRAIESWVKGGGVLWTSADSLRWDEYADPSDLLQRAYGLSRTYTTDKRDTRMTPATGETALRAQPTPATPVDTVSWTGATVRARYGDGRSAWLEKAVGTGKVIYLAHRAGLSYSQKSIAPVVVNSVDALWCDFARVPITRPLFEAKVERELILSEPDVMASALDSDGGTVIVLHNMQARPLANLQFSLRMATQPVKVEYLKDVSFTDLPFTYENGRAIFTVPSFDGPAMVTVRTKAAPVDERLTLMRENTVRMFASEDPQDLAAAAWFTGFHPQWKLEDRLLPLLAHDSAAVRRAAAEACGRLKLAAAGTPLAARLKTEADMHVLAYGAQALGQIGHAGFPEVLARVLAEGDPFARQHALRGALAYLQGKAGANTRLISDAQLAALAAEPDRRVRDEYLRLLALITPDRVLAMIASGVDESDKPVIAELIAGNATLLAGYCAQPGRDSGLLLGVASRHADPRLARLLLARLDELMVADATTLAYAALTQKDRPLARALFAKRAGLADYPRLLTLMVLDGCFGAHLGNDAAAWEEWLAKTP